MPEKLDNLFSPINIGDLKIKNRIVRSATFELKGDHGKIGKKYLDFYKKLVMGGAGTVITGYGTISPENRGEATIDLSEDTCIDGLTDLANMTREYGDGCKIIFQLNHMGRQFRAKRDDLLAPSAVREPVFDNMPKAMTIKEIDTCIDQFAKAIHRCKKAGLDGVQLHAAHGWLLSSFLSGATNLRTDEFGGNTEKRARIMVEIIERARALVGNSFPIMAKINGSDFLENGIEVEEAIEIARILIDAGYDALEVSSSMWATTMRSEEELGWKAEMIPEARIGILNKEQEGYHRSFAGLIKKKLPDATIMVVGGFRSPEVMEEVIRNGEADMVSLCRPLIKEPGLPARWQSGNLEKAKCISCNKCLDTLHDRNLHCPLNESIK